MIEKCTDKECGFENRLQYCEVEARNRDNAEIVVAVIDELLFDSKGITSNDYGHKRSVKGDTSERVFNFLFADGGRLSELDVWLRHERQHSLQADLYTVELSRLQSTIAHRGNSWQSNRYAIELYPSGAFHGSTYQINPSISRDGKLVDAMSTEVMRNYDYEQLFDELAAVCQLHEVELAANLNSLKVASSE